MRYIKKDQDGKITKDYSGPQPGLELVPLSDDSPEYQAYASKTGIYEPPYDVLRKRDYPPAGEQLDAIWKVIKHLKESGISISPEGEAELDKIQDVKTRHPKR